MVWVRIECERLILSNPIEYTRMAAMGWKLDFGGLLCYHNHYHSFWLRKYQECPFLLKAVNEKYLYFFDKLSKDRAGPWGNEFAYRYLGASGGFNAAYCVACSPHLKDIYKILIEQKELKTFVTHTYIND